MELILTLAMKFWQWTVLIAVVIIGAIINLLDKKTLSKVYRGIIKPENSDAEQYWTNGITFVSTASDG